MLPSVPLSCCAGSVQHRDVCHGRECPRTHCYLPVPQVGTPPPARPPCPPSLRRPQPRRVGPHRRAWCLLTARRGLPRPDPHPRILLPRRKHDGKSFRNLLPGEYTQVGGHGLGLSMALNDDAAERRSAVAPVLHNQPLPSPAHSTGGIRLTVLVLLP